jgi:lysozyme family protein
MMDFDRSFEKLIGHEGGYVNHPSDPGGETNFGISKRSYPMEDIKAMTLDRAKDIYRHDFWAPAGCDAVPEPIKFDLFDMAVNSGVRQAIKTLQKAVGTKEDGLLGGLTLQAASSMSPDRVLMRFNACRLLFMTGLAGWPSFGKGWARRIAENQLSA